VIFLISLIGYYVHLHVGVWFELILAAIPLITGYAGARLIPYNLWLAYGRLKLVDGGIFFVFPILGPAWAVFLFWSYPYFANPILGTTILLSAASLSVLLMARQYKRTGATTIPVHLWVILYGSILVLYEIGLAGSLYGIVSLFGLILTFAILLAIKRIRLTLPGALGLLATVGVLLAVLQYSIEAGGLLASLVILVWLRWGKAHISLPLSFWCILLVDFGAAWGLSAGGWSQVWASSIYSAITLIILFLEYGRYRARQFADS
jgi:hypothetical protein